MFFEKFPKIARLMRYCVSITLVLLLVFSQADQALAARSGGRIGGGFRAPSRTYSPAPRGGGGYGYPGGGGIGFPFLLPLFGFGGGGIFTLLIFMAIASFLVRALSNAGGGSGQMANSSNPTVAVAKVQVGLLANARKLQKELDQLALSADTDSASGRAMVLQEASLALLRHPEYWYYGSAESDNSPLSTAEGKFNQLALAERSKFTAETLSNVDRQLRQADIPPTLPEAGEALAKSEGESQGYIVVTLIAGVDGKMDFPAINDTEDLRRALQQMGGIGSDRLLAFEVLWTPQAEGDTLTKDDIFSAYPNLKLV